MALRIQIAKFKFCQYLLRANLPNLMLAKLSCYTVLTFQGGKLVIICMHAYRYACMCDLSMILKPYILYGPDSEKAF